MQMKRPKKKMLKRLQTCDKKSAARSFRRRRVTKVKWGFSRWIFVKVRNVKIHWENVYFLRMSENEKKRVRRRVVLQGKDFLCADIIYKVLLQLRKALRVTYWNSAPVRVLSTRQGRKNRHRLHQWSLFMKFSTFSGHEKMHSPRGISLKRIDWHNRSISG